MKVYIVWGDPCKWETDGYIYDICSTREVAEKVMKEGKKENPEDEFSIEIIKVRED